MSALDELVNKWVKHDHPEKMPGLEVCVYEASLIDGLEWAAEEGAETLASLRAELAAKEAELTRVKFTPDGSGDFDKLSELDQWIERYNFMRVRGDDAIQQLYALRADNRRLREALKEIDTLTGVPPMYAWGDNDAAGVMATSLHEIGRITEPICAALSIPAVSDVCPKSSDGRHSYHQDYELGYGVVFDCTYCGKRRGSAPEKSKCICTDYLNFNPDPVANPDCPIHGSLSAPADPQEKSCSRCNGTGIWDYYDNNIPCPDCDGRGLRSHGK
jgi:hypothetical protein